MWKLLELDDESFMFRCREIEDNVQCIFFKIRECFIETLSFTEVYQRAKKLNKRIIVDERTLREILFDKNVVKATRNEGNVFVLEYRIQNCPFYFEWHMHLQSEEEARITVIYPLIEMAEIMYQKINELCDYLQQKDEEIEQYKIEGAVLVRRTVATEKFDVDRFRKVFHKISHSCLSLNKVAKQERDFIATRNLKNFENNTETQKTNEVTPQRNKQRGHKSPRRRMSLRKCNTDRRSKRLAYIESESQSQSEEPLINVSRKRDAKKSKEKEKESKKNESRSYKLRKVENSNKNSQLLLSSEGKTRSVAKGKSHTSTIDADAAKEEKSDPKSEIIIIPKSLTPKKSLVFESVSLEKQETTKKDANDENSEIIIIPKTPTPKKCLVFGSVASQKQKKIKKKVADDSDFDMNELFTWKDICNKSTNDTSRSVEQILQGLRDLESHRKNTI